MQPLVFISYSRIDKEFARRLLRKLAKIGINCFLDEKNIEWGNSISDTISGALKECAAVIVIISPASLKSAWVPFEVGQAVSTGKRILPLLTHPALDVPLYLANFNCVKHISDAARFFESESWKQYVASLTKDSPPISEKVKDSLTRDSLPAPENAKSGHPDYGILVTALFKLIHFYVSYSSIPPTATYDELQQNETVVRDWLFENKLACDFEVYEECEKYILRMRGYINLGNKMVSLLGGDGRPTPEQLVTNERELLEHAKLIEQRIRSIQKQ